MTIDDTKRLELINGLRGLADFYSKQPTAPPSESHIPFYAFLPPDSTITDVLAVADRLAPCTVDTAPANGYVALQRQFGPLTLKVFVKADLIGEKRTVSRDVTEYMIDPEVLRAAAEGTSARSAVAS